MRKRLFLAVMLVALACSLAVFAGACSKNVGTTSSSSSASLSSSDSSQPAQKTAAYTVEVYKQDFGTGKYVLDASLSSHGEGAVGATIGASDVNVTVSGYVLNGELSAPIVLGEGENVLKLHFDAVYAETADAFGGSDLIYLTAEGAYLKREGFDGLKKGAYNAINGVFAFTTDDGTILDGRVVGDVFYYYPDAENEVYSSDDGATISFGAHGAAVYTGARGGSVLGTLALEPKSGRYTFTSNNGRTEFDFVLELSNGARRFVTAGAESGYYAMKTAGSYDWVIFYLDGFGGGLQLWNPLNPYVGSDGSSSEALDCTYERVFEGADIYGVVVGNYIYYIRIDSAFAGETLGGYVLDGSFAFGDGLTGEYNQNYLEPFDFELDGFGRGNFRGADGSYEVVLDDLTGNGYIIFTTDGGEKLTIGFSNSLAGDTYYRVLESGNPIGRYDISVLLYDGMVYTHEEVPTCVYITAYGLAYVYAGVDYGDGRQWNVLTYCSMERGSAEGEWILSDYLSETTFTVRLDETERTAEILGDEYRFTFLDGGESLTIDADGVAHYSAVGGSAQVVSYTVEEGVCHLYTFKIGSSTRKFMLFADGTSYEIDENDVYDIAYTSPERTNALQGKLILLGGGQPRVAAIGLLMQGGGSIYALTGSVEELGGGEYTFEYAESLFGENSDYYYYIMSEYGSFRFKTAVEGGKRVYYQYDSKLQLDCSEGTLELDGYGTAELTLTGGEPIVGAYVISEGVVFIYPETGARVAVSLVDGGNGVPTAFKLVGDVKEVGYYYELGSDNYLTGDYLFFDGAGTATLHHAEYNEFFGSYDYYTYVGTYRLYNPDAVVGYTQYEVTIEGEKHLVLVSRDVEFSSGTTLDIFIEIDAASVCDFTVVGETSGFLMSDGYNMAVFGTYGGEIYRGMVYVCDYDDSTYSARGVNPNPSGSCVWFFGYNNDGELFEFIFDVTGVDEITLRKLASGAYASDDESGDWIYLDGYGRATVYNASGEVKESGAYSAAPEIPDAYIYNGESGSFCFGVHSVSDGDLTVYEYSEYTNIDGVFTSGDWSVLMLDGFGGGTYINRFGVSFSGEYEIIKNDVFAFKSYDGSFADVYFKTVGGSFTVITDDFIVEDGVLYFYKGSQTEITIPAGVKEIAAGAFKGSSVTKVDFGEVTAIGENAFANSMIEEISSTSLKRIADGAFRNAVMLKSANIPAVTEIGAGAFADCTSLSRVILENIAEISENAFARYGGAETLVVDLSAASVSALKLHQNAFGASVGGSDAPAFVVKLSGIDAVNAALASEVFPSAVKENLTISGDAANKHFFDFAGGKLYTFDSFGFVRLSEYDGGFVGSIYALYKLNGNSAVVYVKTPNGFNAAGVSVNLSETSAVFNGATALAVGANSASPSSLSFTADDGETVVIEAWASQENGFSLNITSLTYGTVKANAATYDPVSGTVAFSDLEGASYTVSFTSESRCTVRNEGSLVTATTADGDYRVTLIIRDEKIQLVKLEAFTFKFVEVSISEVTENADGSLTAVSDGSPQTVYYNIAYNGVSVEVAACVKPVITSADGKFRITAVLEYGSNKLIGCEKFEIASGEAFTELEIESVVITDGGINVTVKSTDGGSETYSVSVKVGDWVGSWNLSVNPLQ